MGKAKRKSGDERNLKITLATAILVLATALINLVDRVLQLLEPR
jgi:hypothetical protein